MSGKPTLVFVPGAWHGPETWDKLSSTLEKHQLSTVSVTLPTTLSDPSSTFSDDVNAVKDAIAAETTKGRDVVLVAHSYGGAVGASAIKGFAKPKQGLASSENSKSGHVIGFFMMATGFMATGVTFLSGLGGKPPPIWKEDTETGFATIEVDPRELFYHDLPEEEGKHWVKQLRKQSMRAFTTGAEDAYAGWKDVPVWYLATTQDRSHPTEVQRMFVQNAKDAGGDVVWREIASSHSPMLSLPTETADIIAEAVEAFTQA